MWTAVYIIVAVVFLFGISILAHELGHFLMARLWGMVVEVFSIGFGPAIWKRQRNGITYKIGAIPFGGYVALPQLDPSGMALVQGGGQSRDLPPAPPGRRIVVSLAGAAGNMALAVALAWTVYLAGPRWVSAPSAAGALVGYVETNSAAYAAGLMPGDEITAANGEKVRSWQQLIQLTALSDRLDLTVKSGESERIVSVPVEKDRFGIPVMAGVEAGSVCRVMLVQSGWSAERAGIRSGDIVRSFDGARVGSSHHLIDLVAGRAGQTVPVIVERGGRLMVMQVTPQADHALKRARIGIQFDSAGLEFEELARRTPWQQISHDAGAIVRMLRALVTPKEAGKAAESIGGPPMILVTLWYVVKVSLLGALGFTRFLNVNLAIINLLPIPVLDGGHVLFALWEMVTRRRPNPRVLNAVVNVFATILIGLILFLCYRDMGRLWHIRKAIRAEAAETNAASNESAPSNAAAGPP
jgi:regulator of sigma E protease